MEKLLVKWAPGEDQEVHFFKFWNIIQNITQWFELINFLTSMHP